MRKEGKATTCNNTTTTTTNNNSNNSNTATTTTTTNSNDDIYLTYFHTKYDRKPRSISDILDFLSSDYIDTWPQYLYGSGLIIC